MNSIRTVKYLIDNSFMLSIDCIISSQSSFIFQDTFVCVKHTNYVLFFFSVFLLLAALTKGYGNVSRQGKYLFKMEEG